MGDYANWEMVAPGWIDGLHPDDTMKTGLVDRIVRSIRSLP